MNGNDVMPCPWRVPISYLKVGLLSSPRIKLEWPMWGGGGLPQRSLFQNVNNLGTIDVNSFTIS